MRGHRKRLWPLWLAAIVLTTSCGGSSWDRSVARANKAKKVLIIEFYATWCTPCAWFEEKVLSDTEVKTALERVEFRRYDYDSTEGRHHANRLGVRAIPAVVAVDKEGKGFRALKGAVPKSTFLRFLAWTQDQLYPAAP